MLGLVSILLGILAIIPAITLHEAAHAYAAKSQGDMTAAMLGRMTLNPLRHIDPVGTVILPLLMMLSAGVAIGWAKPVPVTPENFKNGRTSEVIVAGAGPAANLFLALVSGLLLAVLGGMNEFLATFLMYSLIFNVLLMIFNLIPVPPLDGGRIVEALLPPKLAYQFSKLGWPIFPQLPIITWGFGIVLVLFFTGIIPALMNPIIKGVLGIFT